VRGDLDSGGAPALAYIDGRRRAGRMESASWTAGWAERETPAPRPTRPQPATTRRVGWVGALRCRFLTSRPAREARGRTSLTTLLGESGIPRSVRRGLELPLLTRAPDTAPALPRFRTLARLRVRVFAPTPLASLRGLRRGPFRFCFSLRSVQVTCVLKRIGAP